MREHGQEHRPAARGGLVLLAAGVMLLAACDRAGDPYSPQPSPPRPVTAEGSVIKADADTGCSPARVSRSDM